MLSLLRMKSFKPVIPLAATDSVVVQTTIGRQNSTLPT